MDFSIIVPSYNRAALIPETLDALLAQTHKAREIIVVDDGSADNTETVVARFPKPVRYMRIENSGPAGARAAGVSESTSEYVAFCDSDDLYAPDKLELHARLFELAPEVECSFSNFRNFNRSTAAKLSKLEEAPAGFLDVEKHEPAPGLLVLKNPFFVKLLEFQPIFASTLVMSRAFYERIGRFNSFVGKKLSEDFEFALRCAAQPFLGVVCAPAVSIRRHQSNRSGNSMMTEAGEVEILEYVLERHPAAAQYEAAIREEILIRSASVAHNAFAAGKFELARRMVDSLPPERRDWKLRVKDSVMRLPDPLARFSRGVLLRAAAASR